MASPSRQGDGGAAFCPAASVLEVIVTYSPSRANDDDRSLRLHPAAGVVCPSCGARVRKPCVSTVRTFGVGTVGTPIEGVHVERIAAAREQGVA